MIINMVVPKKVIDYVIEHDEGPFPLFHKLANVAEIVGCMQDEELDSFVLQWLARYESACVDNCLIQYGDLNISCDWADKGDKDDNKYSSPEERDSES